MLGRTSKGPSVGDSMVRAYVRGTCADARHGSEMERVASPSSWYRNLCIGAIGMVGLAYNHAMQWRALQFGAFVRES